MKCFIGLGSNLGDRRANLENAAKALSQATEAKLLRASPIVETPALVPEGASEGWRKSFLNAVIEIEWLAPPGELLKCLKKTETELGRETAARWAPRLIDLDLLTFGNQTVEEENLRIPHPEIYNRQFVLAPLKHLAPSLKIPGHTQSVLERSRSLHDSLPLWMGVLNLTPDSFSDGNAIESPEKFGRQVDAFDRDNTQILDLGAESTRPGAVSLSPCEEWNRLAPTLELVFEKFRSRIFRPWISVDTYHPETAAKALSLGVNIINDVSGLASPAMLGVLKESACQYVLMHSLTVPADPSVRLDEKNPIQAIKEWTLRKLEQLNHAGVNFDRVIFDPGVGFGKTAEQSLLLIRQIHRFSDLPVRVLVGHSRKSFLNHWEKRDPSDRDFETLGISLKLADKGVDILRVHKPDIHQRTFRTFREA